MWLIFFCFLSLKWVFEFYFGMYYYVRTVLILIKTPIMLFQKCTLFCSYATNDSSKFDPSWDFITSWIRIGWQKQIKSYFHCLGAICVYLCQYLSNSSSFNWCATIFLQIKYIMHDQKFCKVNIWMCMCEHWANLIASKTSKRTQSFGGNYTTQS